MKMLVTGGAGFIGTNFIYYMQRRHQDLDIVCLDSLTYAGNIKNLESARASPHFRFFRGDITDWTMLDDLFQREKFDSVVNFAAESHVDRSIENPGIFVNSNIVGVQMLLDACRKHGTERFHQVSTDEVYGDLPLDRPDLLFTERTPLHASSPYSASKAGADLLALAYHRTFGMKVTISRCSNNYGPYQFPEKLIPKMIMLANKNRPLPVYGKGENIRDWLHTDDHCQAIDLIVSKGRPGEIYNVGGNNERRNIDIVRLILKEMGKDAGQIEYVADRKGHDLRYAIDATKIRNELGWKPAYDFDNGIKGTIRWYLDNIGWLNDVESGAYRRENESVRNDD
jgi:dTDP-glucose 4,6-dehydratase